MAAYSFDATVDDVLNMVVLETGFEKEPVEEIVKSFIKHLTDISSMKNTFIDGLGTFEGHVKERRYYDLNDGVNGKIAVRGRVKFIPSRNFIKLVETNRQEELLEKLSKAFEKHAASQLE